MINTVNVLSPNSVTRGAITRVHMVSQPDHGSLQPGESSAEKLGAGICQAASKETKQGELIAK